MIQLTQRLMIAATVICTVSALFLHSRSGQSGELSDNRTEKMGLAIVEIDKMHEITGDPERNRQAGLDPKASAVVLEPDADGGWTGKFHALHWFRKPPTTKDISEMRPTIRMKFPHNESRLPVGLEAQNLRGKKLLMEIGVKGDELIGTEMWEIPKLDSGADKKK
jgi:hypothetical protein